jgi:hypothetical protein
MKVAIHPTTLDVREFKSGLDLFKLGYVVVSGVEDMPERLTGETMNALVEKFRSGKRANKRTRLATLTKIWPDIVLHAMNNIRQIDAGEAVIEELCTFPESMKTGEMHDATQVKMPDSKYMSEYMPSQLVQPVIRRRVGRGNHKPRLPVFEIADIAEIPKLCPQASILAFELQKLRQSGKREMTIAEVPGWLRHINLATVQPPLRIFRYYFWKLVEVGVIKAVNLEPKSEEKEAQNVS